MLLSRQYNTFCLSYLVWWSLALSLLLQMALFNFFLWLSTIPLCVCMCVYTCIYMYIHTHVYTYTYVYTYTDTCMYIYINVYTHTHTHTHTPRIFIYSSIFGHLSCFCVLVIASGVLCIIDGVHKSFELTVFSTYIPRNGLLDHMTVLFFCFLRNPHSVFHKGCTNLHFYHQCGGFPYLHIPFSVCYLYFLVMAVLTSMKWYLIVPILFAFLNN